MRILVIEDETSLREDIVESLTYEGFEVLSAENGRIGVEKAQAEHPDLIVCDIAMPELDGYQVLLKLRENTETTLIPFIFLTAMADRSFMRHGMELGADDYLTKPFTNAELMAAVRTRFERQTKITEVVNRDLEEAKKQLTRMVTHELRTPLSSVLMVQDLISRQLEHLNPDEIQELMGILRSGSLRLNHLVEQMVLMTQMETSMLSEQVIQTKGMVSQLWDVIVASINMGRRFAYRRQDGGIRFDEFDRQVNIRCDKRALIHALAEIISNGLDFSPDGEEVIISQWAEDDVTVITIKDRGVGISPDQLKNALRFFQQIDRESQEQQGMGLGLPLARHIIDVHGGKFQVESGKGKGTLITIRLPLVR